jgi:hypothetical protein
VSDGSKSWGCAEVRQRAEGRRMVWGEDIRESSWMRDKVNGKKKDGTFGYTVSFSCSDWKARKATTDMSLFVI